LGEDERSKLAATVQPGEYWLIEQPLGSELSSLDRSALGSADIVIYDRPLAPLVAQVLPIGRYAEPLFENGEPQPAVSPRALRFATEGWRVAQLLEARRGDNQRLHDVVEALIQLQADDLPLLAIAKRTVDKPQLWDGRLHDLPELIDKFAADDPLTLILGPLVAGCAAPPYAFAGNGLAG
jgi:siroheme synthase